MNDFSQLLRDLRRRAGWTQAQLADRIGVSERAIGNYENGRRMPKRETLVAMSTAFGVDLDYLVGKSQKGVGTLSYEEIAVIDAYRKLSVAEKNMVCRLLDLRREDYT